MKKILLSLLLLLITVSLYAEVKFNDPRLLRYPEARQWSKDADTNGESAYNIGVLYQQTIKDNKKAIEWFTKAYGMDDEGAAGSSANNLGYLYDHDNQNEKSEEWYKKGILKNNSNSSLGLALLYDSKKLHQYNDAIFYYKKAYSMGNSIGAHNLGLLYKNTLNNPKESVKWYKKAAKGGYADSINNLSLYYLNKKDYIMGSAYVIASIEYGYDKKETFDYLKNDWKIDQATIKKAYQLQKTLDIPKHYYDPELEDKPLPKKKTGRR